ncbi:unnamed protein product [Auanema sp. JU1783]|nr:unnamed protein product [Auanema sp. JU1783]
MWKLGVLLLATSQLASAATCGGSSIPFRFEVLPSGTPVLGCGSPTCFGAQNGGRNVLHDTKFNVGPDGEDGFIRDGDVGRSRSRYSDAPSQIADCPSGFDSQSCVNPLTWVGGFLSKPDGSLSLQCCHYSGLRFGAEVGRPIVHAGEVYSGGEVLRDGRQTGFDLISNVKKVETEDGSIAYELTVTRMNCLPDPPEIFNDVNLDASNEISRILDKVGEVQHHQVQQTQQTLPVNDNTQSQGLAPISPGAYETNHIQQDTYAQPPPPQDEPQQEQFVQVGEQVVPVTEAGYYYPVASGIPACFTADTLVDTPAGTKRMDQLEIGDLVLTSNANEFTFTPVLSFMHRLLDVEASFIKLETPGNLLKLTPQHFIYKTSCNDTTNSKMVYAEDVNVGDCLYESSVVEGQALNIVPVVKKSVVRETGVFAPMTATGDLFVNNIYASCHNVIKASSLTHTFLNLASTVQSKILSMFGGVEDGHLPATAEFLLQAIDYIIPHKH